MLTFCLLAVKYDEGGLAEGADGENIRQHKRSVLMWKHGCILSSTGLLFVGLHINKFK